MSNINQSDSGTYCNNCGVKGLPGSKFCFGCGEIIYQQNTTQWPEEITPTSSERGSWISKYWRGSLPLVQTFWVIFFLPNLFYEIVHWLAFVADYEIRLWHFQVLAVVVAVRYPVFLWQTVGCWRSTLRHINHTGRILWAQAAQLMLFLSVSTGLTFGVPVDIEIFDIATRSGPGSTYTLTIIDSAETLNIEGEMSYGIAEEVGEILEQSPEITLVSLNSLGGYIDAGQQLRDLIKFHNLSTYVLSECSSACTDAFMGGINRILGFDAVLGFHRSDMPYWDEQDTQNTIDGLLEYGVSEEFASRVAQVETDDMWYPNLVELISNNIITRYVDEAGNLVPVQSVK